MQTIKILLGNDTTLVLPIIKSIGNLSIHFNPNYTCEGVHNYIYTLTLTAKTVDTRSAIVCSNNLRSLTKLGKAINEFIESNDLMADMLDNNRISIEKLKTFITESTVVDLTKTNWSC